MKLRRICNSNQLVEWKKIRDDLNWNFSEVATKHGVYAYLTTPTTTTITSSGVYQYISGTFANEPMEMFDLVSEPAIRYLSTDEMYFEIVYNASLKCNVNGTTVHTGVKKNGVLLDGSVMCTYCKYANEIYNMSGTIITKLNMYDKIQLVVTTDGDNDIVTFEHYTTSIREFFK